VVAKYFEKQGIDNINLTILVFISKKRGRKTFGSIGQDGALGSSNLINCKQRQPIEEF